MGGGNTKSGKRESSHEDYYKDDESNYNKREEVRRKSNAGQKFFSHPQANTNKIPPPDKSYNLPHNASDPGQLKPQTNHELLLIKMLKGNKNYGLNLTDINNEASLYDKRLESYVSPEELEKVAEINKNYQKMQSFIDSEFPCTDESISLHGKKTGFVWRPINEIMSRSDTMSLGGLNFSNVMQGDLSDAYLLSMLCVLSERKELLFKIFVEPAEKNSSMFSMWLNDSGEWKVITLDNMLPCTDPKGGLVFAKGKSPELYAILLEKAYSKMLSSYQAIEGGYAAHALRDLTGIPYEIFDPSNIEGCWEYLKNALNNNKWLLIASTSAKENKEVSWRSNGGVNDTADQLCYEIIQIRELQTRFDGVARAVRLQNPWNLHAAVRTWQPDTEHWSSQMMQELIQSEQYNHENAFWISINQFAKEFSICACFKFYDNYVYSYLKLWHEEEKETFIIMYVEKGFHGFVGVHQRDERCFKTKMNPETNQPIKYDYSDTKLSVAKINNNQEIIEVVGNAHSQDRDTFIEAQFEPGLYLIHTELNWCQTAYKDFVVSVYGGQRALLTEFVFEGNKEKFLEILMLKAAACKYNKNNSTISNYGHLGEPTIERVIRIINGYLVFYYNNKSKVNAIREKIQMTLLKGLQIQPPFTNNEAFEIELGAGKETIVIYKIINEDSFDYQYKVWSNLFVDYPNPEDMKQFIIKNAKKVIQKKLKETPMPVWMYICPQPSRVFFLWINESEFVFDESITFNNVNLIPVTGEETNVFLMNLRPHTHHILTLKSKDITQQISLKYTVSNKFRKYIPQINGNRTQTTNLMGQINLLQKVEVHKSIAQQLPTQKSKQLESLGASGTNSPYQQSPRKPEDGFFNSAQQGSLKNTQAQSGPQQQPQNFQKSGQSYYSGMNYSNSIKQP